MQGSERGIRRLFVLDLLDAPLPTAFPAGEDGPSSALGRSTTSVAPTIATIPIRATGLFDMDELRLRERLTYRLSESWGARRRAGGY